MKIKERVPEVGPNESRFTSPRFAQLFLFTHPDHPTRNEKYLQGGRVICTSYCPLKHNILLYCDLSKILPAAQCYTKPKSFDQILAKLSPIFIEKVLSTESCPPCLMCFALDHYPAQITNKDPACSLIKSWTDPIVSKCTVHATVSMRCHWTRFLLPTGCITVDETCWPHLKAVLSGATAVNRKVYYRKFGILLWETVPVIGTMTVIDTGPSAGGGGGTTGGGDTGGDDKKDE